MSDRDVAISIESLSKAYRIGLREELEDSLLRAFFGWFRAPLRSYRRLRRATDLSEDEAGDDVVWALRDVSLEVRQGEVLGIIGRNGSGKSTLLKVLSRITSPTAGRATIRGEVSSLLEIGTGFHPELTGRENVYLNGAILGLTRRGIDQRFDAIVDFAGVDRFLDTPVKHYSSGMRVRLAFSVAAHLEPEVLLIDEVLAVGDAAFQRKCLGKMQEVAGSGRTVLFVSHSMSAIAALCDRVALLDNGKLIELGESDAVIERYLARSFEAPTLDLAARTDRAGNGALRIEGLDVRTGDGVPVTTVLVGQEVQLVLRFAAPAPLGDTTFGITLLDHLGRVITTLWTEYTGESFAQLPASGEVVCTVPRFPLLPGLYSLRVAARVRGVVADAIEDAAELHVLPGDFFGTGRSPKTSGLVVVPHAWRLREPGSGEDTTRGAR